MFRGNQTDLREDSCKNLEYLGIKINKEVNDKVRGEEAISAILQRL